MLRVNLSRVVVGATALALATGVTGLWLLAKQSPRTGRVAVAPHDCVGELGHLTPLSQSDRELGVKALVMQDARSRAAKSCARSELGCLYSLRNSPSGWFVRITPHPFNGGACVYTLGAALNYSYAPSGAFVREMPDL